MTSRNGLRIALSVAVLGVTALSSTFVAVATATAAGPKVVVTPSTNLRNNETVYVSGSGFKPGDTVFVVECLRTATGSAGCKLPTGIPSGITITAGGLLPRTSFKVSIGKIGNGTCGTTRANLAKCAVSVGNASGGDTGVGNIVFAAPAKK